MKQYDNQGKFVEELRGLLNRCSMENQCDTPDWILADYIKNCLKAFSIATHKRDKWWGHKLWNKKELKTKE